MAVAVEVAVGPSLSGGAVISLRELGEVEEIDGSVAVGVAGEGKELQDVIIATRAVAIAVERTGAGVRNTGRR